MSKRESIEINSDILTLCIEPMKKTHIVYKTNINFKLLHRYVPYLVKRGFLSFNEEKEVYQTTSEGLKWLKMAKALLIEEIAN